MKLRIMYKILFNNWIHYLKYNFLPSLTNDLILKMFNYVAMFCNLEM